MHSVAGQLLPLALTVAFTTLPIVATLVVLLNSPTAMRGWMLTVGYTFGLALVLSVVIFGIIRISAPSDNIPDVPIVPLIELVVGAALLVLGIYRVAHGWRQPARVSSTPRLVTRLQTMSNGSALAVGFSFALHPENLLLCAAASARILADGLPLPARAVAIAAFCLVGVSTVVIPTVLYATAANRVRPALSSIQNWLIRNSHSVTSVLLLGIGVVLIFVGAFHFV